MRNSKLRPTLTAMVCSVSLSLSACGDDATGDTGEGSSEGEGDSEESTTSSGDGDSGSDSSSEGDGDSATTDGGDGDSSTGGDGDETSGDGDGGDGDGGDGDTGDGDCVNASDCDDGLYCNGVEQCIEGSCAPAESAVLCSDGIDCTTDVCDEDADACTFTADDTACTDAGAPSCLVDVGCVETICNNDNDCNDFTFCNGLEECVYADGDSTQGYCVQGAPPVCDDGNQCTDDFCSSVTDLCDTAPTDCSDGLYCNGDETCDESLGCVAGTPVPIDDGLMCTIDSCDELNDEVVHELSPACDNGSDFDDDGDCYCEGNTCTGSENPSCQTIQGGDCNDALDSVNPGAVDVPDLAFVDANCDSIDGDRDNVIYLDPENGNDNNSGTFGAQPKKTLSSAFAAAQANNRDWIVVGNVGATTVESGDFVEGISVAGGYLVGSSWARNSTRSNVDMPSEGALLSAWSLPTEYQLMNFAVADAPDDGSSSFGFRMVNVNGVLFSGSRVAAGDGGTGSTGATGATGTPGGDAEVGSPGCEQDGGSGCGECSQPLPGVGGTSAVGNVGGEGGAPGLDNQDGNDGVDGIGPGGAKGNAGVSEGGGTDGSPGTPGGDGSDGAGGSGLGTFSQSGYVGVAGAPGGAGVDGGGGGGGGGGAGGNNDCNSYGGAGGGGGGGGEGGGGGGGGGAGGASVAIYLQNSDIELLGGTYLGGSGGDGGLGGSGGGGGDGGLGKTGGANDDDSGSGGDGGPGGAGGDGGDGGGGTGGPSYVFVCRDGSNLTETNNPNVMAGTAGAGGGGVNPGAGSVASVDNGCD